MSERERPVSPVTDEERRRFLKQFAAATAFAVPTLGMMMSASAKPRRDPGEFVRPETRFNPKDEEKDEEPDEEPKKEPKKGKTWKTLDVRPEQVDEPEDGAVRKKLRPRDEFLDEGEPVQAEVPAKVRRK